ncbi:DUF2605 domain-containing protein [Oscillatoria sp. CS-180]|uniref:DUF2605 domain-containing protein n=1 Tax=Oscillatoria sp. CS-180 TaxID=3021720 RepID=UPI00232DDC40|nr:DUF2605 domain-containing protein [Oscillatoria sp. CS-180]MDB9526646.1 DUF2605 domain-containing protein [Oscillatoria sp. CS-180]
MFSQDFSNQSEPPLLQSVLEPLLDDFKYWFSETEALLTSDAAQSLESEIRQDLMNQIQTAQQEVATARTLLLATSGNAGVDTAVVAQWHQLVNKCWQAARHIRQSGNES